MVSLGVSLLYVFFFLFVKRKDKYLMKLSELVEMVSKKKIFEYQKELIFDVVMEDVDGEDVEVLYIKVKIRQIFKGWQVSQKK